MVEPQVAQQVAPAFINWSINVYDLILLSVSAVLLYGRLVKIETQIQPIVEWWNQMLAAERLGRRWTADGSIVPSHGAGKRR